MSLVAIAEACQIPETDVRRRMAYWTSRGVVRESHHSTASTIYTPSVKGDNFEELSGITYEIVSCIPSHLSDCSERSKTHFSSYGDIVEAEFSVRRL